MTARLRKPAERPGPAGGKKTTATVQKKSGRCPICGKPVSREHRPFCSKRCAEIDLGRWLKGAYAVPGAPVAKTDDDDLD